MKYERIVSYVASQLWAITPEKWAEIASVLAYRASGAEFTPEEIQARIGGAARDAVQGGGAIGVVPIRGTIAHRMGGMAESSGGASTEGIGQMFDAAASDESIGTILLDADSGGGTVTGVPELADAIYAARSRKRIVALCNGVMGSACYWLCSQAHEIISIPSGSAGSIGVFTAHRDMSAHLAKEGINVTLISAGKHKVSGHPFAPLDEEELAVIQANVDAAYAQFVSAVARGRGVKASDVRSGFGEGRMLRAEDALAAGLIDRIDTVEGSLRAIAKPSRGLRADAEVIAPVVDIDADRRRRLALA